MGNISILYYRLLKDEGALVDHYLLQHEDVKVDCVEHTLETRIVSYSGISCGPWTVTAHTKENIKRRRQNETDSFVCTDFTLLRRALFSFYITYVRYTTLLRNLDPILDRILSYPAVAAVTHQFCKEEMRVLNYYQRLQMYLKMVKKTK